MVVPHAQLAEVTRMVLVVVDSVVVHAACVATTAGMLAVFTCFITLFHKIFDDMVNTKTKGVDQLRTVLKNIGPPVRNIIITLRNMYFELNTISNFVLYFEYSELQNTLNIFAKWRKFYLVRFLLHNYNLKYRL